LSNLYETWVQLSIKALTPHIENKSQLRLKIELNMTFSVILMSGLFMNSASEYSWLKLEDDEERELYLNQSLKMLLPVK